MPRKKAREIADQVGRSLEVKTTLANRLGRDVELTVRGTKVLLTVSESSNTINIPVGESRVVS